MDINNTVIIMNVTKNARGNFSLLTHNFHDSVSQEGSTALQVAEAFDV